MAGKVVIFFFFICLSHMAYTQIRLPMDTIGREIRYEAIVCIDTAAVKSVDADLETYLKSNFVQGTFKSIKWERDSLTYMFKGWRNANFGNKKGVNVKSWMRITLSGRPDSLLLRLDEFTTQDFASNDMPNPQQNRITDLYYKYLKKHTHNGEAPVLELYLGAFDEGIKSLQSDLIGIINVNCQ